MHDGPLVLLAGQTQAAVHQFHQPGADGQPQSHALVLAQVALPVELIEGPPQGAQRLFGDAPARILDFEEEPQLAGVGAGARSRRVR